MFDEVPRIEIYIEIIEETNGNPSFRGTLGTVSSIFIFLCLFWRPWQIQGVSLEMTMRRSSGRALGSTVPAGWQSTVTAGCAILTLWRLGFAEEF